MGQGCCSPGVASQYGQAVTRLAHVQVDPETARADLLWLGYSPDDVAALPPEVLKYSFGSGNPLGLSSLRPGDVVLDVGSGAGLDALIAARRVGPSGRVIGVDMTPEMVARAKEHARLAGVKNVEFRLVSGDGLPLEDGSVDVVTSNCVLSCARAPDAMFAEVLRVLKPGGRLLLSDVVDLPPQPAAESCCGPAEAQAAQPSCCGPASTQTSAPSRDQAGGAAPAASSCGGGGGFLTLEEYLGKVKRAGFDRVEVAGRRDLRLAESPRVKAVLSSAGPKAGGDAAAPAEVLACCSVLPDDPRVRAWLRAIVYHTVAIVAYKPESCAAAGGSAR